MGLNTKKTILFVSQEYPPYIIGGAGVYIYNLIKWIKKINPDLNIHLLTFSKRNPLGYKLPSSDPDRCIRLSLTSEFFPLRYYEFYIKANIYIKMNEGKYSLIHDNYNIVTSCVKTPFVTTVHSTQLLEMIHSEKYFSQLGLERIAKIFYTLIWRQIEKRSLEKSSYLIFPSRLLERLVLRNIKAKRNKIIYHGIDLDVFHPISNISPIYDLLFVGRFVPRKGLFLLISALKLIKRKLKILFCGKGSGFIYKYIKNSTSSLNHIINFLEGVSYYEMPKIYNQSRITVIPSEYESFGFVVLESLACGVPIIVTNTGIIPEIADDLEGSEYCYILRYNTSEELAKAIEQLLDYKNVKEEIFKNAKEKILNKFSWENTVKETLMLYDLLTE